MTSSARWIEASMTAYTDEELSTEDLPTLRPAQLLLAEEDDALRQRIASGLRHKGYEVDEVFSGFEAVALIARHREAYDLIISDLELPGLNGLEMADELRASRRSDVAGVPMILLGDHSGGVSREAARLHAVVLDKPGNLTELLAYAERLARPVQLVTEGPAASATEAGR
jgi:DNA-binding response OmpR family regulator